MVRWRKQEGEPISRGEIIAEIETDKATVEMEAFSSGVLGRIVAEEGRTVPVGELIAIITEPGEAVPAVEDITTGQPTTTTPAQAAQPPPAPQQTSRGLPRPVR